MKRHVFSCMAGFCGVLLLCAAMMAQVQKKEPATPAENESSAVGSIRSVNTVEVVYSSTYPQIGFTCTLTDFSPPANGQKPSPKAANMLATNLTSGTKNGYKFTLTCPAQSKPQRTYQLTAVPVMPGKSGTRAFCTDQTTVIRFSADGQGASCMASGKPIT